MLGNAISFNPFFPVYFTSKKRVIPKYFTIKKAGGKIRRPFLLLIIR